MSLTRKLNNPVKLGGRKPLTAERLRELLRYDPETGVFVWATDRYAGSHHKRLMAKAGDVAGSKKANERNVYRTLTLDSVRHYAHRLAWLYMTGSFPARGMDVDHIDADSLNNRFANLRCASRPDNIRNSRRHIKSTSGLKGVSWHKGQRKWRAVIRIDGRQVHLGSFDDPNAAHAAYVAMAKDVFGEFARAA